MVVNTPSECMPWCPDMIRLQKPTVVESPARTTPIPVLTGRLNAAGLPAVFPPLDNDDPVLDTRAHDEGHEDAVGKVQIDGEEVHQAEGPQRAHNKRHEGGEDRNRAPEREGEKGHDEDDGVEGGLHAGVAKGLRKHRERDRVARDVRVDRPEVPDEGGEELGVPNVAFGKDADQVEVVRPDESISQRFGQVPGLRGLVSMFS